MTWDQNEVLALCERIVAFGTDGSAVCCGAVLTLKLAPSPYRAYAGMIEFQCPRGHVAWAAGVQDG